MREERPCCPCCVFGCGNNQEAEVLRGEIASLKAQLAEVNLERDKVEEFAQANHNAWQTALERAEKAEAALAQKEKELQEAKAMCERMGRSLRENGVSL